MALILVCSVVVNVLISIAIAGLFKCCDSKMIECKLDKHIQYTQDMFNQPMDEKGFLKFYFNKKMIHAKLKVLVETLEKRDTSHMGNTDKKEDTFSEMNDNPVFVISNVQDVIEINPYEQLEDDKNRMKFDS